MVNKQELQTICNKITKKKRDCPHCPQCSLCMDCMIGIADLFDKERLEGISIGKAQMLKDVEKIKERINHRLFAIDNFNNSHGQNGIISRLSVQKIIDEEFEQIKNLQSRVSRGDTGIPLSECNSHPDANSKEAKK